MINFLNLTIKTSDKIFHPIQNLIGFLLNNVLIDIEIQGLLNWWKLKHIWGIQVCLSCSIKTSIKNIFKGNRINQRVSNFLKIVTRPKQKSPLHQKFWKYSCIEMYFNKIYQKCHFKINL